MSASSSPAAASLAGAFTADAFAQALAAHAAAPTWWLERKRVAYEKFAALPLPKRTDETWRFSTIGGVKLDGFELPGTVGRIIPNPPDTPTSADGANGGLRISRPTSDATSDLIDGSAASLTFVDNQLSDRTALTPELAARGLVVSTLAEALQTHSDILRAHFMAQPQKLGSEKFAALHAAFIGDGAFIYIPRGVELSQPIVVTHRAAQPGGAVFPHTLVVAEENSRATVIDRFVSSPDGTASGPSRLAVGANDLYAGHGAQLTYVGIQDWAPATLSFQLNSTVVRRDARVQSLNVHLGARQARHESLSQLQAPGALSEMLAVTVAKGAQEFDQRTLQLHQAPNTKSDLLYKNALLDTAKTIFSGLIIVDPDAQKTDAYQSNRNLMLSDEAEANSLPGLEIQANDVRCTHGATTSRIDPEQEFYLKARGIAPAQANELLIFGFFEEVLNRLEDDAVHAALRSLIQSKFKR